MQLTYVRKRPAGLSIQQWSQSLRLSLSHRRIFLNPFIFSVSQFFHFEVELVCLSLPIDLNRWIDGDCSTFEDFHLWLLYFISFKPERVDPCFQFRRRKFLRKTIQGYFDCKASGYENFFVFDFVVCWMIIIILVYLLPTYLQIGVVYRTTSTTTTLSVKARLSFRASTTQRKCIFAT